jgi:hypothetical protein
VGRCRGCKQSATIARLIILHEVPLWSGAPQRYTHTHTHTYTHTHTHIHTHTHTHTHTNVLSQLRKVEHIWVVVFVVATLVHAWVHLKYSDLGNRPSLQQSPGSARGPQASSIVRDPSGRALSRRHECPRRRPLSLALVPPQGFCFLDALQDPARGAASTVNDPARKARSLAPGGHPKVPPIIERDLFGACHFDKSDR